MRRPKGLRAEFVYPPTLPRLRRLALRSKLKPQVVYFTSLDAQARSSLFVERLPTLGRSDIDDAGRATKALYRRAGLSQPRTTNRKDTREPAASVDLGRRQRRYYVFVGRVPYEVICSWTTSRKAFVLSVCEELVDTLGPS